MKPTYEQLLRWYERNKVGRRLRRRVNPDKFRAANRATYKKNRHKYLEQKRKHSREVYALKKLGKYKPVKCDKEFITIDEWRILMVKFNNSCAYCKTSFSKDKPVTVDHVIPRTKGGTSLADNIVPSCLKCNIAKSNT